MKSFISTRVLTIFLLNFTLITNGYIENEIDFNTISSRNEDVSLATDKRYFLYEVNFGEGFNLRRDVYMRVAQVVQALRLKGIFLE